MNHRHQDQNDTSEEQEGTAVVSEGGSGALNADTSLGGADSVPDTPDVNTAISDEVDINEESQEGAPPRSEGQPN